LTDLLKVNKGKFKRSHKKRAHSSRNSSLQRNTVNLSDRDLMRQANRISDTTFSNKKRKGIKRSKVKSPIKRRETLEPIDVMP
jgi:hypothetical protein